MALLSLTDLTKRYGALVVTDGISLEVADGEIVGILGPNGAGKTTLFNLVAGTVRPDAGKVTFQGDDVTRLGVSERCRRGISRSFQIPHPFCGMTVFENLLVGATFGRLDHATPAERAGRTVLAITGLSAKANTLAGSLTLLERKRLEMARALCHRPQAAAARRDRRRPHRARVPVATCDHPRRSRLGRHHRVDRARGACACFRWRSGLSS